MVFCAIALLVLLALYVGSVGVGARERRGQGPEAGPRDRTASVSLNAPWVQKLRDRLTAKLKSEDLSLAGGADGCGLNGTDLLVPVDEECEYEIAPAKQTRALYPKLVQGQSAAFGLEQDDALEIEDEPLAAGAEVERYDVYRSKEPATLTVAECEVNEGDEAKLCRVSLE
jgi:hypothetical protein